MAIVLVHVNIKLVVSVLVCLSWNGFLQSLVLPLKFAHVQVPTAGIANFMSVIYRKLSIYDVL